MPSDPCPGAPPVFPCGLLPGELSGCCAPEPAYRGKQVFRWLAGGAKNLEQMTDLPSALKQRLTRSFSEGLYSSRVEATQLDKDGTGKLKIRLMDGAAIESVLLSDPDDRLTACLSTQVGCPMGCAFCKTGTLGFLRNLEVYEIVEQFYHLSELKGRISNIVYMGMGEPLLNLPAVRKATEILTHADGVGLSKRKVTISTCGLPDGIRDLADNGPKVRLAVSLTCADDGLRDALMPVNRKYNLNALKQALLYYQQKTGERITLEAALMKGLNTDTNAATAMALWIKPLQVQVNIIPWNPVEGLPYKQPDPQEVRGFLELLAAQGVNVVKRSRRGRGVNAACGQLGETLL